MASKAWMRDEMVGRQTTVHHVSHDGDPSDFDVTTVGILSRYGDDFVEILETVPLLPQGTKVFVHLIPFSAIHRITQETSADRANPIKDCILPPLDPVAAGMADALDKSMCFGAPLSPKEGDRWHNTADGTSWCYDGIQWVLMREMSCE